MIDGRMNNLPVKPRKMGTRISVLDRLHLKTGGFKYEEFATAVYRE